MQVVVAVIHRFAERVVDGLRHPAIIMACIVQVLDVDARASIRIGILVAQRAAGQARELQISFLQISKTSDQFKSHALMFLRARITLEHR